MIACRPLLGTYVEIRVDGADPATAAIAIENAVAAISRVQRLMSVFEAGSDISRINRKAHHQAVTVDEQTMEILALARQIYQHSAGLFDCSIAPQLAAWGMLPGAQIDAHCPPAQLKHLHLLPDNRVQFSHPLQLDLGGIAKGYAVDQGIQALLASGISEACINAGGDLRIIGAQAESIHLRNPRNPTQLHFAGTLQNGAFASSGTYFSQRECHGKTVSALVHPASRSPLDTTASYSVIAPTCAVADGLTKVLALSQDPEHPCFAHFSAHPMIF